VPTKLRDRIEWILNLADNKPHQLASNHRRNINKARRHGIVLASTTDAAAADVHARLMAASMHRRSERGENVPTISEHDTRNELAFLASGAARIYQAVHEGRIVSSMLVLNAPAGAYYHSAGTTPEGMEIGASTFLVSEIIRDLTNQGRLIFNLGGATDESAGLQRFKSGFGAQPVPLSAGVYQVASPIYRGIRAVARRLR
jgi:lipid II:glycine glycyltransferase (peptidoglycan interpeptide bridge formation enzyme)